MSSADSDKAGLGPGSEAVKEMDEYGITCVPVYYFHYGKYRYTNLADAVAEAKR